MKKSEEILEKHIVLNDCIGYLGSDGRLYKAIIDALNEAINYTHCCTELKELDSDNFEDWIIVNGYAVFDDYYLKNDIAFSESDLIEIYNKEVMNL